MTWSERMKLAWTTFKREALPLYGWTLFFCGAIVVLIIALTMGVIEQLRWLLPNIHTYGDIYSYSQGMPVPGIPPTSGIIPFPDSFNPHGKNPYAFSSGMYGFSRLLPFIESIAGTLLLILIVSWLIGSAFYTGIFNLTSKAYCEKVSFKDFRFAGFFRVLGWQALIILIQLILLAIGLVSIIALRQSEGALAIFLIAYALLILIIGLYTLPWLTSSGIYLLAHRELSFRESLIGSWQFFRRKIGTLWGYIGTVIMLEIAVEVLSEISQILSVIVPLVVSPFIAVLAIVWVLSLEEDILHKDSPGQINSTDNSSVTNSEPQAPKVIPHSTDSQTITTYPSPGVPKLNFQKTEPFPPNTEGKPPYCPSCGKSDAGTAYCPQCGTKLR